MIYHLRKIQQANPDTLEWIKRQLETLFSRVEDFSSSVSEWFILEQYLTSVARFRPIAVATTVWDPMALVDETLEWKALNAPDLVGRIMYMSEDREYRIIQLPRQRPRVDWSDIRPGG